MKKIMMLLSVSLLALQLSAQSDKKVPSPPPPPPPPKFQKAPPPPPPPPEVKVVRFTPPLLNDKGYDLSVTKINNVEKVVIRNKASRTLVNLSTWNSKKDFYEKKYGELPPPPPPAPQL